MNKQKITGYAVLMDYPASLAEAVHGYIKKGWRPWGAPFMKSDQSEKMVQAMIQYESLDESD